MSATGATPIAKKNIPLNSGSSIDAKKTAVTHKAEANTASLRGPDMCVYPRSSAPSVTAASWRSFLAHHAAVDDPLGHEGQVVLART